MAEPQSSEFVYRGSSSSDISPDLLPELREAGLAVTRREIEARCQETPEVVRGLLRRSSRGRYLLRLTYLCRPLGPCTLDDIPEPVRRAARELGFQPLLWVLHGPVLPLRTPNFIGPEGFVKLEVFGGQRIYLFTYLDDGTEVETAPGTILNVRTVGLQGTGDLAVDYAEHLACVLQIVRERGCRPIYRGTPEALLAAWRLYPAYFTPFAVHFVMLVATLGPIAFVLYQLFLRGR